MMDMDRINAILHEIRSPLWGRASLVLSVFPEVQRQAVAELLVAADKSGLLSDALEMLKRVRGCGDADFIKRMKRIIQELSIELPERDHDGKILEKLSTKARP